MSDCELCTRELVLGPSIDEHHLIPKLKGGKRGPTVIIHKVCHAKIHSIFTESELARIYNTIEKLLEHPEIEKFVKWVSKKHPEFYESSRESNGKRRKRR
jgi:hypothetical protein